MLVRGRRGGTAECLGEFDKTSDCRNPRRLGFVGGLGRWWWLFLARLRAEVGEEIRTTKRMIHFLSGVLRGWAIYGRSTTSPHLHDLKGCIALPGVRGCEYNAYTTRLGPQPPLLYLPIHKMRHDEDGLSKDMHRTLRNFYLGDMCGL